MAGQYELGDLSGVLGGDLYNSLFGSKGFDGGGDGYNFSGDMSNPWMNQMGYNESSNPSWGFTPTDEAMNAFNNYSFNWNPEGGRAGTLTAFDPSGKAYGTYKQKDDDDFTKLMGIVAPAVASWGFGGALSGMFGGGALGGAMGHGLASGSMSSMQGGSFGNGFLSGAVGGGLNGMAQGTPAVMGNNPSAYVPATPGTSIAGLTGVTNPIAAGMVNRGAGSFLGSLATGSNGSDALKSGLTGAALSGINSAGKGAMDFFGSAFKGLSDPGMGGNSEFDNLMGSGGDMSGQTDVTPSHYNETVMGSDGMETANANYGFGGALDSFSQSSPNQFAQSAGQSDFSLASILGNASGGLGRSALSNVGDLASMLYGFYNNRKQQKALGQQISSLQGLYGQNSPYATQLRNTLNAKAAQSGRRSNVAGRETQFQAMLADRYAQVQPNLFALNQAKGQLNNSLGSNTLSMLNKMGAFQGLANLFGPSTTTIPYNNGNVSGSDTFGWKGAGGM